MNQRRNKILESFKVEDLENPMTLISVQDALEAVDMEEMINWKEKIELILKTG